MSSPIHVATVSAPTNIAVIKYWGKANVALNTPLNDSLSLTLDQQDLRAVTTVAASYMFTSNRLWLNGTEITTPSARFDTVLEQMKQLAQDSPEGVTAADWKAMKVHVSSYNTFPTAAGLASSAAGYAALVAALAQLYHAKEEHDGQFSVIARQGSGSACRSLYGGFVAWQKGTNDDHNLLNVTSRAKHVASELHWPLCALILVVSSRPKHTSSTLGMQTSVATSTLLQHRATQVVPHRIKDMEEAIRNRNFPRFAELTMQDSNQFHAICLDTYPPICYLNDISLSIIQLVTDYNQRVGEVRCAYTFDAGPNAVLYVQPQHLIQVAAVVARAFGSGLFQGTTLQTEVEAHSDNDTLPKASCLGGVERVYVTKVGPGPQVLRDVCNLDPSTGLNTYTPPTEP